jgi:hypothetical protein
LIVCSSVPAGTPKDPTTFAAGERPGALAGEGLIEESAHEASSIIPPPTDIAIRRDRCHMGTRLRI